MTISALRPISSNLSQILPACKIRETIDLYLPSTTLRLSKGKVSRVISGSPVVYNNSLKSVSNVRRTLTNSIDRLTIVCQNIDSQLGLNIASSLRLLDYAMAWQGRQFQSIRNETLIEDNPSEFFGVVSNAEANALSITFEIIVDYESLGAVLGSRGLSPRCWWTYKNGIECTSTSSEPDCPKTRDACKIRGKEWEFGGWEFWGNPTVSTPGSGGNDNSGYEGDNGGIGRACFSLDTEIWSPKGDIKLGDLEVGKLSNPLPCFSFNPITGEIEKDEIIEVFEHIVTGFYTFEFADSTKINVTPEHPFYVWENEFKVADKLQLFETVKFFKNDEWKDVELIGIKWNSEEKITVRNCHVRKNHTYFANRAGVHNLKELFYE